MTLYESFDTAKRNNLKIKDVNIDDAQVLYADDGERYSLPPLIDKKTTDNDILEYLNYCKKKRKISDQIQIKDYYVAFVIK
jgi:hypothetical protein